MKRKKVISTVNLPVNLPVSRTVLAAIALDFWNAPGWVWGATGFLFLLIWAFSISKMIIQKEVEIFKDNE